jgi:2-succinyl-5-enolpyruvyl-6-hydroxy-3-cyclohexene-1-carboxylate synthase
VSDAPPNVNTLWGRVFVDEIARAGLRHAAIAPGSRSTPLVVAFAAHPDVQDHSLIDERAAAFFALGVARATGEPAAVVTTSGTAAGNLLPAVMEADRAGVPLLLLTADRPPELRDAGESQAADQVKLFGERVRWFHLVAEPAAGDERLRYLRSTACEAWARAAGAGGAPGPVHLDFPFRKPLAPVPAEEGEGAGPAAGGLAGLDPDGLGAAGRPGGAPWRRLSLGLRAPDPAAVEELALALASAERPLLLAGALNLSEVASAGADLRRALARLLESLPLPAWAEATSQLRLGAPAAAAAVEEVGSILGTASLFLGSEAFRRRAWPDLVLRLGEAPLDWPLRRFAAALAAEGVAQVAIDPWGRRRDPEHAVSRTVVADPALLLDAVAAWLERHRPPAATDPGWLARHREADRAAREALARALAARAEPFDGGVLGRLGRLVPDDAALVVSSSMALRELESFLVSSSAPVDVFSNRGLNGIDGVTATALGIAAARRTGGESRTLLVTGDVAFAHDLSGAAEAGRSGSDLAVLLLNNGGGAIFDHLSGATALGPVLERHFTTAPGIDFGAVVRGLGWTHAAPGSWEELEAELADAFGAPRTKPHLIELRTGRGRSCELRLEVLDEVAAAVDRTLA